MGLKNEIDMDFIANSICMDKVFKGYYLILEGETDELLFSKFFIPQNCQLETLDGKENVIELVEILHNRNFHNIFAIIDKDLDWFDNKIATYPNNIFTTDFHDVEITCISSDSFFNVIKEYCSKSKIQSYGGISNLIDYLISLSIPIGLLRLYNYKNSLNLSFKPSPQKPKPLDYSKFICKNNFTYNGHENLIETIKRYYNQAIHLENANVIKALDMLETENHVKYDIAHGHDFVKIFLIGLKKKIGKSISTNVSEEDIERSIRLAYSFVDFKKTKLYANLIDFQKTNGVELMISN